jgi:hypothetical protein
MKSWVFKWDSLVTKKGLVVVEVRCYRPCYYITNITPNKNMTRLWLDFYWAAWKAPSPFSLLVLTPQASGIPKAKICWNLSSETYENHR